MKFQQSFTVQRPIDEVWAFFTDVPAAARCLPGAAMTEDKGDGGFAGKVSIKLGPFSAAFEGDAQVAMDEVSHTGRAEGKGVDKRGGSRSKLIVDFALTEAEPGTRVAIDADVTLAGPIAQFGRTGLIVETANVLIREFAKNLERALDDPDHAAAKLGALKLAGSVGKSWIKSKLSRSPDGRGGQ